MSPYNNLKTTSVTSTSGTSKNKYTKKKGAFELEKERKEWRVENRYYKNISV